MLSKIIVSLLCFVILLLHRVFSLNFSLNTSARIESSKSSFEQALNKLSIPAHSYTYDLWPDLIKTTGQQLGGVGGDDSIDRCYNPTINAEQGKAINIFESKIIDIVHHYFLEHSNLIDSSNLLEKTQILVNNLRTLIKLIQNCQNKSPEDQSQYGLTSMSSMSYQAYLKRLNNFTISSKHDSRKKPSQCQFSANVLKLPKSLDWRTKGVITHIKNQKNCGSCYIFTSLATIESHYMIHTEKPIPPLSEQEWVNCIPDSCGGGFAPMVYDAIIKKGGCQKEKDIPYTAKPQKCTDKGDKIPIPFSSYCYQEKDLTDKHFETMLYNYGPLYVAIDAKSEEWQYSTGIYKGSCTKRVNHAITMVGYDDQYWILKNSWGNKVGDKGFFKLPKGENKCGINILVGHPFIEGSQ